MAELDTSAQKESLSEVLLNEDSVSDYLVSRGLTSEAATNVTRLAGGVSNVVLAAEFGDRNFVVKQSLAQLMVADEWLAPTDRVITEAETMELLARITPDNVPIVYDQDAENHAITLQLAPADWADWKARLMAGHVRPAIAETLGSILASWHLKTFRAPDLGERLEDYTAFELLRVDPYYRTVARRVPDVADDLNALIEEMGGRRLCLVHGDFSPKNILVAPDSPRDQKPEAVPDVALWVIDFEVAHRGDPAFDIAFMCSHLLLKSLALPDSSDALDGCLRAFMAAYATGIIADDAGEKTAKDLVPLHPDPAYTGRHIGALLLARVKGKSPIGYLDASAQQAAWRMGMRLIDSPLSTIDELFIRRNESRS